MDEVERAVERDDEAAAAARERRALTGVARGSSRHVGREDGDDDAESERREPVLRTSLLVEDAGPTPIQRTPDWMSAMREGWRETAEAKLARVPRDADGNATSMVFDDVVVGTTAVTTVASFDDVLAAEDALAIQVVVTQVTSSGGEPVFLTVAIEHASDGRCWLAKSATPEIDAVALSTTATTVAFGADAGSTPSLGFVRLRLSLAVLSGTPSARVHLHVKSRSK